jgi:hypothetical protein
VVRSSKTLFRQGGNADVARQCRRRAYKPQERRSVWPPIGFEGLDGMQVLSPNGLQGGALRETALAESLRACESYDFTALVSRQLGDDEGTKERFGVITVWRIAWQAKGMVVDG